MIPTYLIAFIFAVISAGWAGSEAHSRHFGRATLGGVVGVILAILGAALLITQS